MRCIAGMYTQPNAGVMAMLNDPSEAKFTSDGRIIKRRHISGNTPTCIHETTMIDGNLCMQIILASAVPG